MNNVLLCCMQLQGRSMVCLRLGGVLEQWENGVS